MIDRRAFLAGSLAVFAAPFAAEAQQAGKVPRVGVLSPGKPPPDDAFHQRDRFEAGLRELGPPRLSSSTIAMPRESSIVCPHWPRSWFVCPWR